MRIEMALALVLLAGPALAEDLDCSKKALSTGVQMTLTACAVRDAQRSDKTLDATYGMLAGKLDDGGRAALKRVELAWIAFRDATCDFETSGYAGGSMRPMAIAGCRVKEGKAREAVLKRYLACVGKDGADGDCSIAFK